MLTGQRAMNWLDVIVLLIVAASVFTSFRKGLSREIIGLVSVVLALMLGIWFYGTAGAFLASVCEFARGRQLVRLCFGICGCNFAGASG